MKARKVSGVGIDVLGFQAMDFFKKVYKTKFNLVHCWEMIKGCPKWIELYNSLKKGSKKRANEDGEEVQLGQDENGRVVRPRGHKATAQDAKHEEAAAKLEATLKGLLENKESSITARYVEKRKDKEEAMACYVAMQNKKLEIEANRIKNEAERNKLAVMAEENRIMMADLTTMDPETRAWVLKKQKIIRERGDI